MRPRWLIPTLVGLGVGILAAVGSIALLSFAPAIGIAVGAALGVGAAMIAAPDRPRHLAITHDRPEDVRRVLKEVQASCDTMESTMHKLRSSPLWSNTDVDDRIVALIRAVRNLTSMPQLTSRERVDGDVQMLHVLGTDYLPTLVNLIIDNDRMHSTFSGTSSRKQVEENVRMLGTQVTVLAEGVDHIETSIVRGTTRSVHEHAAFLQLRFEQLGYKSVLDLDTPFASEPPAK